MKLPFDEKGLRGSGGGGKGGATLLFFRFLNFLISLKSFLKAGNLAQITKIKIASGRVGLLYTAALNSMGGKFHLKLNMQRETDSSQVPRGKDETKL